MGPKIASEKLIWKAWWAEVGQGSAMTAPGRAVDKRVWDSLWISAAGPPWAFLRAGATVVSLPPHVQESLSVSPGPAMVLGILPYVSSFCFSF